MEYKIFIGDKMEDWYKKWRIRIREAQSEKDLNRVIDAIFEEGIEAGKEDSKDAERDYDNPMYDLD